MSNYLAQYSDTEIEGHLTKARDNSTVRTIEKQLLDGTYVIQTVGSAATEVEVEFYCELAARRELQGYANIAALIKVHWEDRSFTGHIRGGKIEWDLFGVDEFKTNFVLLVLTEEEV